jgi:hypothetical protein
MYLDFSSYDYVSCEENAAKGETRIRRWLGVSHKVGRLVSYSIDAKRDCHSPYHGAMRNELGKQTEEFKYAVDEFDIDMKCHFEEDDELGFKASKPNLKDWSEWFDSDFQEEFDKISSDPSVPEADKEFTSPDVVNDTTRN